MSDLGDPTGWTDREREFFAAGWNECVKMQPGENERLRAALAPFGKIAANYERADAQRAQHHRDERGPDYKYPPSSDGHRVSIGLGECRAARAALSANQQRQTPEKA